MPATRTILLDNGHETEWDLRQVDRPDYTARDLIEATRLILAVDRTGADAGVREHVAR